MLRLSSNKLIINYYATPLLHRISAIHYVRAWNIQKILIILFRLTARRVYCNFNRFFGSKSTVSVKIRHSTSDNGFIIHAWETSREVHLPRIVQPDQDCIIIIAAVSLCSFLTLTRRRGFVTVFIYENNSEPLFALCEVSVSSRCGIAHSIMAKCVKSQSVSYCIIKTFCSIFFLYTDTILVLR